MEQYKAKRMGFKRFDLVTPDPNNRNVAMSKRGRYELPYNSVYASWFVLR